MMGGGMIELMHSNAAQHQVLSSGVHLQSKLGGGGEGFSITDRGIYRASASSGLELEVPPIFGGTKECGGRQSGDGRNCGGRMQSWLQVKKWLIIPQTLGPHRFPTAWRREIRGGGNLGPTISHCGVGRVLVLDTEDNSGFPENGLV